MDGQRSRGLGGITRAIQRMVFVSLYIVGCSALKSSLIKWISERSSGDEGLCRLGYNSRPDKNKSDRLKCTRCGADASPHGESGKRRYLSCHFRWRSNFFIQIIVNLYNSLMQWAVKAELLNTPKAGVNRSFYYWSIKDYKNRGLRSHWVLDQACIRAFGTLANLILRNWFQFLMLRNWGRPFIWVYEPSISFCLDNNKCTYPGVEQI